MRTRKEIEFDNKKSMNPSGKYDNEELQLEVLLDIRDFLYNSI